MSILLIPPQYREKIPDGWTLKKIYLMPLNVRYVKSQIIFMLKSFEEGGTNSYLSPAYAERHNGIAPQSQLLRDRPELLTFVDDSMQSFSLIPNYAQPLQVQWHEANKIAIYEIAKTIHLDPSLIDDEYDRRGGSEFAEESIGPEYANHRYTNYSMRGGTWHPEDLFTESSQNRENPYWRPVEVRFDPSQRGPGNKWTRTCDKWANAQMNPEKFDTWGDGSHPVSHSKPQNRGNDYYLAPMGSRPIHDVDGMIRERLDELDGCACKGPCSGYCQYDRDDGPNDPPKLIVGNYNMWENLTKRHYAETENNTEDRRVETTRTLGY